jgi:hypothetical protein
MDGGIGAPFSTTALNKREFFSFTPGLLHYRGNISPYLLDGRLHALPMPAWRLWKE